MGIIASFMAVTKNDLTKIQQNPNLLDEISSSDLNENNIDLDKAWHGIHFLLTGQADGGEAPLAWAITGGEILGDDPEEYDQGYGPALFLTTEQVQAVAQALSNLSKDEFAARFDAKAMAKKDIYPNIWERDSQEALDYLLHYYEILVAFYQHAAARNLAVIQWLS
jgi:hypothetical protein